MLKCFVTATFKTYFFNTIFQTFVSFLIKTNLKSLLNTEVNKAHTIFFTQNSLAIRIQAMTNVFLQRQEKNLKII